MGKQITLLRLKANESLAEGYSLLRLTDDERPLPPVMPGQFVQVRTCNCGELLLRRPISVNFVDEANNELWLLVHAVGKGTRRICETQPGEKLDVLFPLGHGFTIGTPQSLPHSPLLVGGGVGTAPLLYLGKRLCDHGNNVTFLLGAKSAKDLLQIPDFEKFGRVFVTTEDGSEGERGFVTQHSLLANEKFGQVYVCGPKPMMMATARYAQTSGIPCEVSLENQMACGLGACLCCVERDNDGHNVCVCKEGPVFDLKRLAWLN